MLSALYRDIIVLFYFDGLSTKQISEKLNIPEGTITWRLSEARKKLKKECDTMNGEVNPMFPDKKPWLRIVGCNDEEAGRYVPFNHIEYEKTLRKARLNFYVSGREYGESKY